MQLNSENKTILVFSDPHQNIDWVEYILKKENYDHAVCLGDWFDSFDHNSEYDVEKTCKFLKKWIFKDNFTTLIGNHCVQYLYDNPNTICSGYEKSKDDFIIDCFGSFMPAIRDKFRWYVWIDDILCTHAGIHKYHFSPMMELTKDGITKWLDEQIKWGEMTLMNGGHHWLYAVGQGRGGRMKYGGINWLCWQSEFEPIDGLHQIVGHTQGRKIREKNTDTSKNMCIDCELREYILKKYGKIGTILKGSKRVSLNDLLSIITNSFYRAIR